MLLKLLNQLGIEVEENCGYCTAHCINGVYLYEEQKIIIKEKEENSEYLWHEATHAIQALRSSHRPLGLIGRERYRIEWIEKFGKYYQKIEWEQEIEAYAVQVNEEIRKELITLILEKGEEWKKKRDRELVGVQTMGIGILIFFILGFINPLFSICSIANGVGAYLQYKK